MRAKQYAFKGIDTGPANWMMHPRMWDKPQKVIQGRYDLAFASDRLTEVIQLGCCALVHLCVCVILRIKNNEELTSYWGTKHTCRGGNKQWL